MSYPDMSEHMKQLALKYDQTKTHLDNCLVQLNLTRKWHAEEAEAAGCACRERNGAQEVARALARFIIENEGTLGIGLDGNRVTGSHPIVNVVQTALDFPPRG